MSFWDCKSVPVTENSAQKPETGIKDSFKELEQEFPFKTSCPVKPVYIYRSL